MPSPKTLSKGVTNDQHAAFVAAARRAGMTTTEAQEKALALFCESVGIEFPASLKHGGKRPKK